MRTSKPKQSIRTTNHKTAQDYNCQTYENDTKSSYLTIVNSLIKYSIGYHYYIVFIDLPDTIK